MKQWTPQMKHKKESAVIKLIEKQLSDVGREYYNIHGNKMGGGNGKPDIFTMDKDGRFVGIEAKAYNGKVYPNQLDRAYAITSNHGRYVVAYADFEVADIDNHTLPKIPYEHSEMEIEKGSCEITRKGDTQNG